MAQYVCLFKGNANSHERIGVMNTTGIGQSAEGFNIHSEIGVAAALEARRLAEKHGSDFLSCEQLVTITGFGRNNVRQLLNSDAFPTITVGNRKAVSVIAFTLWSLRVGAQV